MITPPPIQGGIIEAFEEAIEHPLPSSYRRFLEDHNGGKIHPDFVYVPDCESDVIVDCLLGFGQKHGDIMHWFGELDDLRGRFIAIGFDPGGNAFLLDYRSGAIYYWDSARHFECSTDEENAYWIADSFENFIGLLKSPPESPPAN
jgi:hypothetical protein